MIDGPHPVRVPSDEEEALRDLVRAREDARGDRMRARRLGKVLLRHDVRCEEAATAWTQQHRRWLAALDLGERGAQLTFDDYLGAVDALVIRRDALERAIVELVPTSSWAIPSAQLRCLRSIDTLSAAGLCAEVGDLERFRPGQLMRCLGLVPSEDGSGERRRQGAITRTGSRHARRLLVEAGWHYRRRPAKAPRTHAPPSRAAAAHPRDLLAGPTAAAPRLAAPGLRARQAPHPRGGRRRARAGRLLLGDRPHPPRLTQPTATHHVG